MPKQRKKPEKAKTTAKASISVETAKSTQPVECGPYVPPTGEKTGVTHLIECTCILPQYLKREKPVFHRFTVFSIINEDDTVQEKIVQCNNCGIVHRIKDVWKSEIVYGRDESQGVVNIDDVKWSLPTRLAELLEANDCELHVWEHVKFILDEEKWGSRVILTADEIDGRRVGKFLTIAGPDKFGIAQYSEEVVINTAQQ